MPAGSTGRGIWTMHVLLSSHAVRIALVRVASIVNLAGLVPTA